MSIPLLNDFPFCKAWIRGGETLIGLHKSFIHLHERTQVTLSPLYCPRKQATQTTLVEQIKSSSLVEKYHVIHATKKGIILWENIAKRADLDGPSRGHVVRCSHLNTISPAKTTSCVMVVKQEGTGYIWATERGLRQSQWRREQQERRLELLAVTRSCRVLGHGKDFEGFKWVSQIFCDQNCYL